MHIHVYRRSAPRLHQPPPKRPRFGEPQKFLPIIFVVVARL